MIFESVKPSRSNSVPRSVAAVSTVRHTRRSVPTRWSPVFSSRCIRNLAFFFPSGMICSSTSGRYCISCSLRSGLGRSLLPVRMLCPITMRRIPALRAYSAISKGTFFPVTTTTSAPASRASSMFSFRRSLSAWASSTKSGVSTNSAMSFAPPSPRNMSAAACMIIRLDGAGDRQKRMLFS